ncbi:uncharacterized protein RCC_07286 [Ramularia collo-cygni]|uniref:Uncharacterized protein n=1 Tax=Ramularia collo-cygni TaxID=112498 RepID=A0A2D3VKA1_9PEZI|nr:uncharacterized protein RCC_07286 [Ramularia collo-cygni]CZT21423.1 uncharacterized protein RCC_07286 [Ramularia collo-cygni]
MVSYDYELSKATLNENDKDRIVCLYLNSDPASVDWAKATKDYGSASVESFKKTTANMLKKLDTAGAKVSGDGNATVASATPAPVTPASGKKRKAKSEVAADGDVEGGAAATPKAKRGRPKKAATPKPVEEDAMDEDNEDAAEKGIVKKESVDDLV